MRGDHTVGERRRGRQRSTVRRVRTVGVGGVAVDLHAERVDAVLLVAALGDVGGREAPVPVLRLLCAVLDLAAHIAPVGPAPRLRRPLRLRYEQRNHQRLEHRASPGGDDLAAAVRVVALPDADAVHRHVTAPRLLLLAVARDHGAQQVPVVVGGQRAVRDAEVTGHARLGVEGSVVVAGGFLGVRPESAAQLTGAGDRVGRVVGRVVVRPVGFRQEAGDAGAQRGSRVRGDAQAGDQPGVVDGREERADRVAGAGPLGQHRTVVGVVPVEPESVMALQPFDGPDGEIQPSSHRGVADHAESGGGDGGPQTAADVGGRGLA